MYIHEDSERLIHGHHPSHSAHWGGFLSVGKGLLTVWCLKGNTNATGYIKPKLTRSAYLLTGAPIPRFLMNALFGMK